MPTSDTRLFIGNLAESLDEYDLVHFLGKHGKISKFDYLHHKAGPKKGRPRGYAFVEYATPEEAMRTMLELNDKLLMGRKVAIKKANDAPQYDPPTQSGSGPWRNAPAAQRSTTLSLLKGHTKPQSEKSKINALEAKLALMEAEKAFSESERAGSVDAGDEEQEEGTAPFELPASHRKAAAVAVAGGLPRKPNAETISTGRKLEKEEPQPRTSSFSSGNQQDGRGRGRGRGRGGFRDQGYDRGRREIQPPPKATLASLGASMGKS